MKEESDSQNSRVSKQADKIPQLQTWASRKRKNDFKARAADIVAKSTGTQAKARATGTKDGAMDPKGEASRHRRLLPGFET